MPSVYDDSSDFAWATIVTGQANNHTDPLTVTVTPVGAGARFNVPTNGCWGFLYDSGTYGMTPMADSNLEAVRVPAGAVSGDVIAGLVRAQLGTLNKLHSATTISLYCPGTAEEWQKMVTDIVAIQTNIESGPLSSVIAAAGGNDSAWSVIDGFRMTLDSSGFDGAQPDGTIPNTSANIYFVNFVGDNISIGNNLNQYDTVNSGPVANAAPTPDGMYDVFTGGGTTLSFEAWYTNTQRNNGIAFGMGGAVGTYSTLQNGNWNSQNSGQRRVGSVYIQSGLFQDDPTARFVYNEYNKVPRSLAVSLASDSTTSSTFAVVLAAPFITGTQDDSVMATANAYGAGSGSASLELALSMNGITPDPNGGNPFTLAAASMSLGLVGTPPNVGLNAINLLMRNTDNATSVTLSSPGTNHGTAIKAVIMA